MLSRLLASILPSQCRICHAWPAQPVCESCITALAQPVPRCRLCAIRVPDSIEVCAACTRTPPVLQRCVAAVDYAWPWSSCIADFKFRGDPAWADALALLMRSAPWAEPLIERCELTVPMPIPTDRLRARGFNQALELARRLSPHTCDPSVLLRPQAQAAQHTLSRAQRLINLHGEILVDPLRTRDVRDRDVLLVDDVMTTGASLQAAAGALLQAGARSVSALVLARTPAPEPGA